MAEPLIAIFFVNSIIAHMVIKSTIFRLELRIDASSGRNIAMVTIIY